MKKTNFFWVREISKNNNVLTLNIFNFFSFGFWKDIKNFNPDIIHYTCGGSLWSFILLKIVSIICKGKTVMTTLQPHNYNLISKFIITKLRTDAILSQTQMQTNFYKKLGFKSFIFPSGVDIDQFKPISKDMKTFLRNKYKIGQEKFVILHVGHIKKGRNLEVLKELLNDENEVLIVGSPSLKDTKEYARLESYGFNILTDFIKNINEIYALSDCYVFPVFKESECISMPLSVLEAMACNLPVISSKFGDLDKIFSEGNGIFFINEEKDISSYITKLDSKNVCTREKVLEYSWECLGSRMSKIYDDLFI